MNILKIQHLKLRPRNIFFAFFFTLGVLNFIFIDAAMGKEWDANQLINHGFRAGMNWFHQKDQERIRYDS